MCIKNMDQWRYAMKLRLEYGSLEMQCLYCFFSQLNISPYLLFHRLLWFRVMPSLRRVQLTYFSLLRFHTAVFAMLVRLDKD